ncbi:MAG: ribosome silencing factor [Epulopiscium sp.]|nr:ribosome silencing factor [Candidatus Epulonipiscium sp.]
MISIAYRALDDKKAEDIKILDIRDITVIADYFVIASGRNAIQVQAMAEAVEEELLKHKYQLVHREGYHSAGWILIDFGSVVIHIFDNEVRDFYCLERLWGDAKTISKEELKSNIK